MLHKHSLFLCQRYKRTNLSLYLETNKKGVVFKSEALDYQADYSPKSVNLDGCGTRCRKLPINHGKSLSNYNDFTMFSP